MIPPMLQYQTEYSYKSEHRFSKLIVKCKTLRFTNILKSQPTLIGICTDVYSNDLVSKMFSDKNHR